MPSLPDNWQSLLKSYLEAAQKPQSEAARAQAFAMLLPQLFADQPDVIAGYCDGIESFLSNKKSGGALRGRADNLFGHLIIEFEGAIPKKRAEAEEQIRRYTAIQWSGEKPEKRAPFLGLATDGVRFIAYAPTCRLQAGSTLAVKDIELEVVEEFDWNKHDASEIYFWLDRTLLRQEILVPTGERIVQDFGAHSHAFLHARALLLKLWEKLSAHNEFAVVRESWEKYLVIVYGSDVSGDDLWIRHSYLATLAKLMSWQRLSPASTLPTDDEIIALLEGELFKKRGIANFIEEDFFSWLAREEAQEIAVELVKGLASLLRSYDLTQLSEDVLKALYQELVDPSERHDLGEYYTPDWLAHRLVNRLLDEKPDAALLDPTCGSGTFLYLAIHEKIKRLGASRATCAHILESVCGSDIHPLAVIIAKTNYILALGDLLTKHRPTGVLTLPVYLADTLRLPQKFFGKDFTVTIEKRSFPFPPAMIADTARADRAIELQNEFARNHKNIPLKIEDWSGFLAARGFDADDETRDTLFDGAQLLKALNDAGRDSIWAYVLKNIYKPLFFHEKFDFIVGNPPWIALRYMEPGYQTFLKEETKNAYHLTSSAHQISNLEIAALFLVRAADLYLKPIGKIGFVLPRSFWSADQHDGLRRRNFRLTQGGSTLAWRELWDCEKVKPLFSVPTGVVIGQKIALDETAPKMPPIDGEIISGKLPGKNSTLEEAEERLQFAPTTFQTHISGKRSYWAGGELQAARNASVYKSRFVRGADITPRSFWFVQVPPSPFGFDATRPPLQSDERAIAEAKAAYKTVFLEGQVESKFLYATLLSTDMLPFGHLPFRLIALPIEPEADGYKMLSALQAKTRGFYDLAKWLETAEKEWQERRSVKAENMNIYERLNHVRGLTKQNAKAKYRVLYGRSSTYLTAAVVENQLITFEFGHQEINAQGFIIDSTFHYAECETAKEAYFLSSVLNAPIIDELAKPMQTRGLFGPRDFYGKIFELPIPQYDAGDKTHRALAQLGMACAEKVRQQIASDATLATQSIGRARSAMRVLLQSELAQIDELVKSIL
jgi:hypothetical protein